MYVSAMRCDNCKREVSVERGPTIPQGWLTAKRDHHAWDFCSSPCIADFFDPLGPRRKDAWGTERDTEAAPTPERGEEAGGS